MNKNQVDGKVVVSLGGRDLTLAMDVNALAELEEATGENPLEEEFWVRYLANLGAKKLRLLFWAMTRSYHKDLSQEDIGRLLSLENQTELLQIVRSTQSVAMGTEDTKKNSSKLLAQKRKVKGSPPASTGSSSGLSDGTTSESQTKSSAG